ncbi:YbhB/YbcL family Raf kinase inhibitor-like protein [Secundilactobacillus malefermentans]|uniref:YbhB/YbcL family Raf kinase inhibitor-like protein n=1 Tax=Secundilactobacillus malefermentans TaxID=176292 RepID=A0A4R5NS63_9LACO|nr:YbhB/YbcL family Raf kinase inhibitor-like protein [Secundilactobacillus malefermentans]KRM59319.1 hypothetical protein FD44_GL001783 [Secundilactobacillus malefermentans DSM 5705 = KCTC 3548]QEA31694.1 YbhB/YbcL family Raf kinase inhibitor-like protein [Secundilactobacillus malefermentans]TDG79966.1 hypothetical protein C5L31_002185 [Secundilactobacillus malefermentans]
MKISIPTDNGVLANKYSKYATEEDLLNGQPVTSFPIDITEVPTGVKTFAVTMIDHDAIPVGGFTWIHWVAANLPGNLTQIPENASQSGEVQMTFGKNSTAGKLVGQTNPAIFQHYTGPFPPDKDHRYTVTVYAIDEKLPLKDGFWLNDLWDAMDGHVLAQTSQTLIGRA